MRHQLQTDAAAVDTALARTPLASHLPNLRDHLESELRQAGYTASDLLEAIVSYFEHELADTGPDATALFIAQLRCRGPSELAARAAGAPRHASSEAHAASPPAGRHGPPSHADSISDEEALFWREANRWGA